MATSGMVGKSIRMDRIMNRDTKKTILVPMDHGVGMGPIPGLDTISDTINKVTEGGANAVVVHKGIVKAGYRGYGKDVGLLIHISASTSISPDPNAKVQVCSVEEAVRKGADGISVHVNIGAPTEKEMMAVLAKTAEECDHWGMPLLSMMYARGHEIKNPSEHIPLLARVAFELGADIVKVPYTGSVKSFEKVVNGVSIPVVIAGGEKVTTQESLQMIKDAIDAGAAGVACGRNVFQHKDPTAMVRAISRIVHEGSSVKEAMEVIKE